jgi:hypothetical protein
MANSRRYLHFVVMFDNVLDGNDGIGAFGHDTAGGDRHRLACRECPRRRRAGPDPRHHRKPARRVRRAHGEPVHGRARKGREIHQRKGILCEHAPRRRRDADLLGGQRRHPLEHPRLRLSEREQLSHTGASV